MKNYTFISEFKDMTYISHQIANNEDDAFILWYKSFIDSPFISKMQRVCMNEAFHDKDCAPVFLLGVSNILCWHAIAWGKSLLVNYMETMNLDCISQDYLYTFIAIYKGGTYIHQESASDLKESYTRWIMNFLIEPKIAPYITEEKEILAQYDANRVSPLIKQSEYIYELHLTILEYPFDLYVTKTPIKIE